jgi:hypothetical protein
VVKTDHQVGSYGSNVPTENRPPDQISQYEIRVAGRLASHWSAWFDGLDIVADADGTTVIRGPVVDQAALHGLIQKLRDVGIPLISLTPLPESSAPRHSGATAPTEPPAHPTEGERQ